AGNTQVPLAAVTKIERGLSPLIVNHQGQFPAMTISFAVDENTTLAEATRRVDQAIAELHLPDTLHAEYAGDARAYRASIGAQPRTGAGAGDLRSVPGALPADHDDDDGGAARRRATRCGNRARLGVAPAARHHHRRRPAGLADAHALYDARHLSAARQAAPP